MVPIEGEPLLEVAFKHPIRLIANALGIAPPIMIDWASGHCGEVSTLAGMMAMGAAGVWTGSVWLATTESETSEILP
jgi:NAD(P)H-dependent flavin oxidoreductase YrpB (nitropropane dioxygenase family)